MRAWVFFLGLAAACGGGGGGGGAVAFAVAQTVPADGSTDLAPGTGLSVTFSAPLDIGTLTIDTLVLFRANGSVVPSSIVTAPTNPRNVRVEPISDLSPDSRFRLVIKSSIRSADGVALGSDEEICFVTSGPEPTVREDQIVDLGDRLNVPRYLPQLVRNGGRILVIGGFKSPTEATDTVEEWDSSTLGFKLLSAKLLGPRAEFTATLLSDGRILIVGGVAVPDGAPLATTEFFDPATGSSPGPPLLTARRWHAASRFRGGVLVSGGFDASGDPLDTLESLEGAAWQTLAGKLGVPTAQHLQFARGFDDVYLTAGNLSQVAARVDSAGVTPVPEGDTRFRPQGLFMSDGRLLVVAGDTRSVVIRDFDTRTSWLGNDLLFDRRGAFSLTSWGSTGRLFLAAGGFQITAGGRAIRSLELVEYLSNAGGRPDAIIHTVKAAELPIAFAGHVGFNDASGATVLAGGIGDGVGDHSRRVVMILDDRTTPPVSCK